MAGPIMDVGGFKAAFKDGGTRPNRFIIDGEIGAGGGAVNSVMVKAGSMPPSTLGIIQVPFRGRVVKIPGDRAYPEWTFTILDSFAAGNDFRRKFEKWNEAFNTHVDNVTTLDLSDENMFTQWTVRQLDLNGEPKRVVSLHNCWPIEVAALDLTYDSADTLVEYTITLAYDWITLDPNTSPA